MRRMVLLAALVLLASTAGSTSAGAAAREGEDKTEKRLLKASEGLFLPSSEASDTEFVFFSYPGEEELPTVERFAELTGCDYPEGGVSRFDFGATFGRLITVYDENDRLAARNARGFEKLRRVFEREYDELAVYRCETGGPEILIYFADLNEDGLSGLRAVSIET